MERLRLTELRLVDSVIASEARPARTPILSIDRTELVVATEVIAREVAAEAATDLAEETMRPPVKAKIRRRPEPLLRKKPRNLPAPSPRRKRKKLDSPLMTSWLRRKPTRRVF
jgi:hypothetical protein